MDTVSSLTTSSWTVWTTTRPPKMTWPSAFARRHPGVQRHHRQRPGGVRQLLRRYHQCLHQVRHQSVPWRRLGVLPQRRPQCQPVGKQIPWTWQRTDTRSSALEHVRGNSWRPDPQRQAILLLRLSRPALRSSHDQLEHDGVHRRRAGRQFLPAPSGDPAEESENGRAVRGQSNSPQRS